jgi:hypothetical protein
MQRKNQQRDILRYVMTTADMLMPPLHTRGTRTLTRPVQHARHSCPLQCLPQSHKQCRRQGNHKSCWAASRWRQWDATGGCCHSSSWEMGLAAVRHSLLLVSSAGPCCSNPRACVILTLKCYTTHDDIVGTLTDTQLPHTKHSCMGHCHRMPGLTHSFKSGQHRVHVAGKAAKPKGSSLNTVLHTSGFCDQRHLGPVGNP